MYFKQNSHIHRRPSGIFAYSSGKGASNQVWISNSPNRIVRIRNPTMGAGVDGVGEADMPGVDAAAGGMTTC